MENEIENWTQWVRLAVTLPCFTEGRKGPALLLQVQVPARIFCLPEPPAGSPLAFLLVTITAP